MEPHKAKCMPCLGDVSDTFTYPIFRLSSWPPYRFNHSHARTYDTVARTNPCRPLQHPDEHPITPTDLPVG